MLVQSRLLIAVSHYVYSTRLSVYKFAFISTVYNCIYSFLYTFFLVFFPCYLRESLSLSLSCGCSLSCSELVMSVPGVCGMMCCVLVCSAVFLCSAVGLCSLLLG